MPKAKVEPEAEAPKPKPKAAPKAEPVPPVSPLGELGKAIQAYRNTTNLGGGDVTDALQELDAVYARLENLARVQAIRDSRK